MYYVYLIKSKIKQWIYIGCTDDLKERFKRHNQGRNKSTQPYKPFSLIYYEAYRNKTDARKREIELKNNNQQKEILLKKLENSLKNNNQGPVV